jgi:hypothetical protein
MAIQLRPAPGVPLASRVVTLPASPPLVHVGIIDVVKPRISADNPFYVRVGICYTGNANSHPASADLFMITAATSPGVEAAWIRRIRSSGAFTTNSMVNPTT